jgi:glycosyltransferase involved in cell wall biosynthesis
VTSGVPSSTTPGIGAGVGPDLRVEAITSGRLVASSRFRVLQHVEPLRRIGIEVSARPPRVSKYASLPRRWERRGALAPGARLALQGAKLGARLPAVARSWRADVTWLEREVLPGHRTLEPVMHRPVLFDVDDAIWLLSPGHERAARAVARSAACVIAGNDFLADWFGSVAPAVERVWTAIDTERFAPAARPHDGFVLGWTGSGSSLRYLRAIAPAVGRFLAEAPEARVTVMADAFVDLPGIPAERLELVPWTPHTEASAVQGFDVGLMPLSGGDWAKGKCAFKMLQYLACAVPAVVSPVGMNSEVLAMADVGLAARSDDEWVEALLTLYRDRDRAGRLGGNGRALAEQSFSLPVIAAQLGRVMRRYR